MRHIYAILSHLIHIKIEQNEKNIWSMNLIVAS